MTAGRDGSRHGVQKLASAGGLSEFVTRALRNSLDQESARSETGLTVLATAGSAAPYIGLFGTVWGIYHALVFIGMSGQGTLDKVAGPVGEALIMTAVGLAVAIPAVLAYNSFSRRNRIWLATVGRFCPRPVHAGYRWRKETARQDSKRGSTKLTRLTEGGTDMAIGSFNQRRHRGR